MPRCVILGDSDPVIICDEFIDDVKSILGTAQVHFLICSAGHDLPMTKSREVLRHLVEFEDVRSKSDIDRSATEKPDKQTQ